MKTSWLTKIRGIKRSVHYSCCSRAATTSTRVANPNSLSVRTVIALVSGRVSSGKTTFYTRAELLRMLFVDLVSASEKARKFATASMGPIVPDV